MYCKRILRHFPAKSITGQNIFAPFDRAMYDFAPTIKPLSKMKKTLCLLIALLAANTVLAQDIDLPAPQKSGGMPLMDALAKRSTSRAFDSRELSLQQISGLLWACDGINRSNGKRTAPSARNCQETDICVIMKSGAYVYDATSNKLNLAASGDLRSFAGTQAFVTNAPVTLVYVADLAKMGKSSVEEKKNYAYADVGFIAQNAYLFCASEGLVTGVRASVDRKALASKLKLRADQMIILAQSAGYAKP
jgi:nitroreductase